jgi:hypothetical protein
MRMRKSWQSTRPLYLLQTVWSLVAMTSAAAHFFLPGWLKSIGKVDCIDDVGRRANLFSGAVNGPAATEMLLINK